MAEAEAKTRVMTDRDDQPYRWPVVGIGLGGHRAFLLRLPDRLAVGQASFLAFRLDAFLGFLGGLLAVCSTALISSPCSL